MLLLIKVLFFQQRAKLFSDFLNNVVCSNDDNKDDQHKSFRNIDKMDMMGRLVACGGTAPINGSQKKSPVHYKLGVLVIIYP